MRMPRRIDCETCGGRATGLAWVDRRHWAIECDRCHPRAYWIPFDRLDEPDWTVHLSGKADHDHADWSAALLRLAMRGVESKATHGWNWTDKSGGGAGRQRRRRT